MPIAPRATRSVQDSALPSTRLSTTVPAGAFGGGEKTFGEVERIMVEERQKADQLAVLDADARNSERETGLLYDPQAGAFNKKGKDAFGVYDQVKTDWENHVQETEKGLANDEQRRQYRSRAVARWSDINRNLQRHISAESRVYDGTVTESWLANERDAAALNYHDPERVKTSINTQRAVIADHARRNGLPGEWVKMKVSDSESKTHAAVIERMLANGQDIAAKDYYETNKTAFSGKDTTAIEKNLKAASTDGEGARIAADVWMKMRPVDDNSPLNIDLMEEEARKASSDPDAVKASITGLRERASAHRAASGERIAAKKDVVWAGYNKGLPAKQIYALPEFQALSGTDQREVRDKLDSYAKASLREDNDALRIEQEENRQMLIENPALLRQTDLEHMHRSKDLSDSGYKSLKALMDPKKSPAALAAFKRLDDSKTKNLFNTVDKNDNEKRWVEYTLMLHSYLENNPDGDPATFVDEIMKPVETGWVDGALDKIRRGAPGFDAAKERKRMALQAMAGETGQAKAPTPAGKVKVISPDGRTGFIPSGQLAEAIKAGYKETR